MERDGAAHRGAPHAADAALRGPGHSARPHHRPSLPLAGRQAARRARGRERAGERRRRVARRRGPRAGRVSRSPRRQREADGPRRRARGRRHHGAQAPVPEPAVLPHPAHRIPAHLDVARSALLPVVHRSGHEQGAREHGGRAELRAPGPHPLRVHPHVLLVRLAPVAQRDLVLDDLRRDRSSRSAPSS